MIRLAFSYTILGAGQKKSYTEQVRIVNYKDANEENVMTLVFYPHSDDLQKGTLQERLDVLNDAAERYKTVVLEAATVKETHEEHHKKRLVPRNLTAAYNWDEIALMLRTLRELAENTKEDKIRKADLLLKLAEIYEILRAAKMPKLEAVRLALVSEATELRGDAEEVA
jgi:hypothetical protein